MGLYNQYTFLLILGLLSSTNGTHFVKGGDIAPGDTVRFPTAYSGGFASRFRNAEVLVVYPKSQQLKVVNYHKLVPFHKTIKTYDFKSGGRLPSWRRRCLMTRL